MLSDRSNSCRGEGAPASADLTSVRCRENNSLSIVTTAPYSSNRRLQAGICSGLLLGSDLIARKQVLSPTLIPALAAFILVPKHALKWELIFCQLQPLEFGQLVVSGRTSQLQPRN